MSELTVDIQRAFEAEGIPGDDDLSAWARAAWLQDHDSEVTVRIVDSEESATLNHQYRGKSGPTNVLSFPFEAPPGITVPLAGDLIISAEVVAREAQEQNKSLDSHWAHMVIHGLLHLQGYDHINDKDAEVMEGLEIQLLDQLGYANPYEAYPSETKETEQDS
ncbi:rRNA maturation RNase YbeY [Marinobacter zhejiangensis]|uniref:Endoribonuclease YbeY n=1 Tax=Marinobacter zhejiangensis TaxID=488535 RepID=A0A1I4QL49_9GAMM|nr:rRNA maturation RNase YbeY [Marinobacter zhejiangensis]SFM40486.1 probable rRNA maturation factor [Marinobacter zhejiangensis]